MFCAPGSTSGLTSTAFQLENKCTQGTEERMTIAQFSQFKSILLNIHEYLTLMNIHDYSWIFNRLIIVQPDNLLPFKSILVNIHERIKDDRKKKWSKDLIIYVWKNVFMYVCICMYVLVCMYIHHQCLCHHDKRGAIEVVRSDTTTYTSVPQASLAL